MIKLIPRTNVKLRTKSDYFPTKRKFQSILASE